VKVPIDKIKVSTDRHRKDFSKIVELATSIEEYGLIEPIVITHDFYLIAGERRLRAHVMLGRTEIEAVTMDKLDEWHLQALELEENVQRENLSWQEEIAAKVKIHRLYQEKHGKTTQGSRNGGWSMLDTSELLGESSGSTAMDIQLAEALEKNPELGKYDSKTTAYKVLKAKQDIEVRRVVAGVLSEGDSDAARVKIVLGDSREVLKGYEAETFDFCITDPPYAVDLDKAVERWWGEVRWVGETYEDEKGQFTLHEEVLSSVYRVLKHGAHCYVFFATSFFTEVKELLLRVGFNVKSIPLVWIKSLNMGPSGNPYTQYGRGYESIFYCAKGSPRKFTKPGATDVLYYPPPKDRIHPAERPVELLECLIEVCSVENEIGLDPFGGSGSLAMAAKRSGRRAVVIEKDEAYYTKAWERLKGGD
jgi:DNA modification methylase